MTVLIGLGSGEESDAAVPLGDMLARSTGSSLVVTAIAAEPWPPRPGLGDQEYRDAQAHAATAAVERARATIGNDIDASYVTESARSVASGLVAAARRVDASIVVLGSSTSARPGRVSLGAVAERILHSLDIPVCFAPHSYRIPSGESVSRLTVGFGRTDHDSGLLAAAATRVKELGIRLRVACFAVRPSAVLQGSIEPAADDLVVERWADQLGDQIRAAATTAGLAADDIDIVVGSGTDWETAIGAVPWQPTELLAIGAARTSPVSRFLLGSHASKIVRHSPVPVLTVAREASDD